ncbi:hypothetical protein BV20DRAFT_936924 [Pilatotrama ljubarskyi]|nr:hypothetical protein BV20DRAFT_936924 [Pilatotrama ljubarskyi]
MATASCVCATFPGLAICTASTSTGATTTSLQGTAWTTDASGGIDRIDFPSLMSLESAMLDQLLAQSASGSQIARSVKHSELAVNDLANMVKTSNLTGRDVLARSLEGFASDAKVAGRDLQKLSSKLYGSVDTILAFNDYALRAIAGSKAAGTGDLATTMVEMFLSSLSVLATEVTSVVLEANDAATHLDLLQERLSTIHLLCEQEYFVTSAAKGALLAQLWTFLGGNRDVLYHLENQAEVLRHVDLYRRISVAHVTATTEILLTVEAELTEIRDKLNAPRLSGGGIPLEVHLASIERTTRRLHDARLKVREEEHIRGRLESYSSLTA